MRFKLTPRFILYSVLCVCLTSEKLWLKNALTSNTGRIAFTSSRDGNAEIYVMDADGRNQENLTNHPSGDGNPDWSPDGTRIAFVSGRDSDRSQIYIMDADGKNPIRLTNGRRGKSDPDWSPDGRKIAFTVNDFVDYIAVMDADGNNREKLEDEARDPSWSPDGGTMAFLSSRDGGNEIYLVGAGGQGLKRVTDDLEAKFNPSFSPDGRRIAYDAGDEFLHIFVVGADGRNRVQLTHNQESPSAPAWSPDGRIIAYDVLDGTPGDFRGTIHLMASDGRYIKQLGGGRNARDYQPDISPLGLAVSPTSNKITIWSRLKKRASDLR